MLIALTMIKLIFAMAVGYAAKHIGILSEKGTKDLTALVINITAPCLIVSSVSGLDTAGRGQAVASLVIGFAIFGSMILLSWLAMKIFRMGERFSGLYQCSFIFPNCSFMGIPVASSLLGAGSVFFITLMGMPYNVLFFSYGIYLLERKSGQGGFQIRKMINAGLIAGVIALVIFFTGFELPEVIYQPLSFVGSLTTPLSMVCVGSSLADSGLKAVFKDRAAWIVSLIRLLAIPLLTWAVISRVWPDKYIVDLAVIMTAMPVGVVMAMVAAQHESISERSSHIVALSSILSMATIPAVALITGIG